MPVNLGDSVVDSVSGFKGIAIGRTTFLHGCTRIGVQPKAAKDGTLPDSRWFDEPQLNVKKAGKVAEGKHNTGGPMPSTPTRNTPG